MRTRLTRLIALLSVAPGAALFAAPASAATQPASCGQGVIVSMPLIDLQTGRSSWNYGYVQLWYNYCTGQNFGHVHSSLGGTTYVDIDVYNNAGAQSGWASGSGPDKYSGTIYSPNNPAGAFGDVVANGVVYYAESDQSGASCDQDTGLETCIY